MEAYKVFLQTLTAIVSVIKLGISLYTTFLHKKDS